MSKLGAAGTFALLAGLALCPTALRAQQDAGGDAGRAADRAVEERARRMVMRAPGVALGVEVEAETGRSGGGVVGVRVVRVRPGSAAAEADVEAGDVIVAVDGEELSEAPIRTLLDHLGAREPGDVVALTMDRNGEEVVVDVTLQEAPGPVGRQMRGDLPGDRRERMERALQRARRELRDHEGDIRRMERALREMTRRMDRIPGRAPPGRIMDRVGGDLRFLPGGAWMDGCAELVEPDVRIFVPGGACFGGVEMHALNSGLERYFGAASGVLVLEVADGAVLPVEPGDVIRSVDGRDVEGPADLRRILRSYESDEEADLGILRGGQAMTVTITVP